MGNSRNGVVAYGNVNSQAAILGIGTCLPEKRMDNIELFERIENFELEKAVSSLEKKGTATGNLTKPVIFDLWVMQMCGIKRRPFTVKGEFADGLVAEDMATRACENALQDAGMAVSDVDHVILSTYSTSRLMPSAACTVVNNLGIANVSVRTLNGACSGFLDALIDAKIKVESGYYKNILVVATENMSDKMNFSDPKSAVIFSDGAGACLVSTSSVAKECGVPNFFNLLGFSSGTTYSEQVYMERKGSIFFNDGPYVQRNAVRTMAGVSEKALVASNMNFTDVQCIIPHQANTRIIAAFDEKIRASRQELFQEKAGNNHRNINKTQDDDLYYTVNCIESLGNLSSATVPVALYDYFGNVGLAAFKNNNQISNFVFTSVGGGYTYSAMALQLISQ